MKALLLTILCIIPLWSQDLTTQLQALSDYGQPYIDSLYRQSLTNEPLVKTLPDSAYHKLISVLFYHKMVTTTEAVDGVYGGILELPYFWHWCSPNPRHAIIDNKTRTKLSAQKPPKGYEKYKSYADIDRTPAIYLENLFANEAPFSLPEVGDFYSFGWCSEREMSYAAILHLLGFSCKIKQEGIHVWSEVLIPYNQKGLQKYLVIQVDNTFEQFSIASLKVKLQTWKSDFGNGAQVAWYNNKFKSPKELQRVKAITISEKRVKDIEQAIRSWYLLTKSTAGRK